MYLYGTNVRRHSAAGFLLVSGPLHAELDDELDAGGNDVPCRLMTRYDIVPCLIIKVSLNCTIRRFVVEFSDNKS